MTKKPTTDKLLEDLDDKYKAINQDRNVHLEGLLHSNSITYWDYIHTVISIKSLSIRSVSKAINLSCL